MLIILRKKTVFWSVMLVTCLFLGSVFFPRNIKTTVISAMSGPVSPLKVIVLDAGHGGEDGGAISPDGVEESHINLEVSNRVCDALRFTGQHVVMTRTEDISLDHGEATIRKRKSADLKQRVSIVNGIDHAILISIHQNSLPTSPVTHGAQVFWNTQPEAEPLAQLVQNSLNLCINPANEKQAKQIPSSVYLMKHSCAPAILVECGFLSNQQETIQLQSAAYQQKLALSIAAGFLRWNAGEEPI